MVVEGTLAVPLLVRFDPNPRRFDLSPWVNRLEALLKFSRSSFELDKTRGSSRSAPRGKLPVIKLPSDSPDKFEIIPDSLFAYEALVKRGLANELDAGLDAEALAKSRAIQALIEENYHFMTKERYVQYGYGKKIPRSSSATDTLLLLIYRWIDQYYYARDKVALRALSYPVRLTVGYWLYRDVCAQDVPLLISCTIS